MGTAGKQDDVMVQARYPTSLVGVCAQENDCRHGAVDAAGDSIMYLTRHRRQQRYKRALQE